MILETERLILRPFRDTDAPALYDYAKDPRVGTAAGWPPHKSVEDSLKVIQTVFASPEVYAVTERGSDTAIGSVGFTGRRRGSYAREDELGYALHPAFWGRGIMPEAAAAVVSHGFQDLGLEAIWCSHYEDNHASRRVIEKLGFTFVFCDELSDDMGQHLARFYVLLREQWKGV